MNRPLWIIALLSTLPLSSCANDQGPWVELRGQRFQIEIADDDATRVQGLMFRDHLDEEHGMLFVFEREQPLSFWMKNTRIPLDILYFDSSRRLVSVAAGVPPCTTPQCPSYPSEGPARFTLELRAGVAKKLGVVPGDELSIAPFVAISPPLP